MFYLSHASLVIVINSSYLLILIIGNTTSKKPSPSEYFKIFNFVVRSESTTERIEYNFENKYRSTKCYIMLYFVFSVSGISSKIDRVTNRITTLAETLSKTGLPFANLKLGLSNKSWLLWFRHLNPYCRVRLGRGFNDLFMIITYNIHPPPPIKNSWARQQKYLLNINIINNQQYFVSPSPRK